jgi:hypothetical protein
MSVLSLVWLKKQKPATAWQSRVLEKSLIIFSEFHSHDAQGTGIALANGHPAIDRRVRLH